MTHIQTTTKTVEKQKFRPKHIHDGKRYLKMKTSQQQTFVHTHYSSRRLKNCLLILAHDKQGHNGFRRTYASLKNRYHWKGMKKSVYQHCTNCQVCVKHNIKTQQLKNEHFSSPPQRMEFIAMDLIEEFHPVSSKGNRFALTTVCMLTGFTFH